MNELVLVAGILSYLTIAVVVRRHFSAMTWPREAMATRIISDAGMIASVARATSADELGRRQHG